MNGNIEFLNPFASRSPDYTNECSYHVPTAQCARKVYANQWNSNVACSNNSYTIKPLPSKRGEVALSKAINAEMRASKRQLKTTSPAKTNNTNTTPLRDSCRADQVANASCSQLRAARPQGGRVTNSSLSRNEVKTTAKDSPKSRTSGQSSKRRQATRPNIKRSKLSDAFIDVMPLLQDRALKTKLEHSVLIANMLLEKTNELKRRLKSGFV